MIGDLKTCLALALGSGLLFGYLYTKFKSKEKYKPDIKDYTQKIRSKKEEIHLLSTKGSDLTTDVERYDEKLNETNLEVTKFKNQIADLETTKYKLEQEETNLKNQYKKQESILNDYESEVQKLKDKLRVDEIENLEDRKLTLQEDLHKTIDKYQQKCDSYEGLFNEKRELEKETSTLSSNITSLKAAIHKKEQLLANSSNTISSVRERLQDEFNKLIESKEENENRISYFKKELLSLKKKLS
jgi:chromosome segregation ATPase